MAASHQCGTAAASRAERTVGKAGKGQIDRRKGEKSGIAMCVSDQLELFVAIQRGTFRHTSGHGTQKTGKYAWLSPTKQVSLCHELKA
jgi:hypothetical protein